MRMDLGIKGRTALVTAASRGIGYACAETLAKEGVNVAICARGDAELAAAAKQIEQRSTAKVIAKAADVTRADDIDRLVATVKAEFGGIDILVAIGGSPPRGTFAEIDAERLQQGFEMTVLSVFRLIQAVLPFMRDKKWGRIVTVQSRSVKEPIPALTVSNATRPGVAGLIKQLSQELAREGILFNIVLPGRILTDRFRQGAERSGEQNYFATQAAELPIGRLGSAQEVADAVAFLASERASYVNGVTLPVDGGLIRAI